MSEETPAKKEEEFLGMPLSKLGLPALGLAGLAVAGLGYLVLKPQIDQMSHDMRNRQAYAQQQQLLAAQAQQQQLQAQQQYHHDSYPQSHQGGQQDMIEQPEQSQQPVGDPSVAIEQDPFQRTRRVRIPEVEADGSGAGRFNNISI